MRIFTNVCARSPFFLRMSHRPHHSVIENAPLIGVSLGLLLAIIPLAPHVSPWASALCGGALLVRLLVNQFHLGLPRVAVKLFLLTIGVGGISLSYGSLVGIEPGLGILLILVSLKILETNTVRDFQVLVLLGWFLSLCSLFFSQVLSTWLYTGLVCAILGTSLIRFHYGDAPRAFRRSAQMTLLLLVQALPIVVLLLVFFTRSYGGFRLTFGNVLNNISGMSDELRPGSVASLAMSDVIAFRVEFLDGALPSLPQLYWRAGVLWQGDGLVWRRGRVNGLEPGQARQARGEVRQRISMEPHGGHWLFALDRPISNVPDAHFEAGGYLRSDSPVNSARRYVVVSRLDLHETSLLEQHRQAALTLPRVLSPRVAALAKSWRSPGGSDREVIDNALRYFRTQHFVYTLEPGTYSPDALDEFLFQRRAGFCEHYAAAFATLMRVAGVPARLVVGYHGGETNRGKYIIVRQSESHVWCEVWLKETGWTRVDPTNVIAPDRITSGLESYLELQAAAEGRAGIGSSNVMIGLRDMLRETRLLWDSLNYQWDLRVLTFDEDAQRSLFTDLALAPLRWVSLAAGNFTAMLVILAVLAVWLGRPGKLRRDAIRRQYDRFCAIMARRGLPRAASEGPISFATRAAEKFPADAPRIRTIADLYVKLRYARGADAPGEMARAMRRLRRQVRGIAAKNALR
jgi:transglutaminase-like putative cysteine protease